MEYTNRSLARLAYSDAARELAERLVSTADPSSDAWGRGASLTEDANEILTAARELLAAAVVADRQRGCSWADVGNSLEVTRQSAQERFVDAEREFREAVLFPHRHPESGGFGYTVAPYAVEEPDLVRARLDQWVTAVRPPAAGRDEAAPVTAGLAQLQAHATADGIADLLALTKMLLDDALPVGVTKDQARRRHAERNVQVLERIASERPDDAQAAGELANAQAELEALASKQASA